MTRTAIVRVPAFVALGSAIALGGVAALGMGAFAVGPPTKTDTWPEAGQVAHRGAAVATSVSFTVDLRTNVPGHSSGHLLVQGQMDFADHTLQAVVTVPGIARHQSAATAAAAPAPDPVKLHTEWVDDHAYLKVPPQWSALAGGAQTVSLPTSASVHREVDTALAQSAVALSYAKILLKELTPHQTVQRIAPRTIGGVATTGSKVDLTLTQLLKLVPELAPTMTKDAGVMADQTIPVSVWIDHQGRLVSVTMSSMKGTPESVTGTVRFSDYDAPVSVVAPEATTVKPLPASLRQLLGGLYYF